MKLIKKILLGILVLFVIIQFIQPAKNRSAQVLPTDISKVVTVPENVQTIFKTSCYDCHSNNTHYPWYSFIQPGAWWMASHIKDGKADVNFSEFGGYTKRKEQNKLQSIINSINDRSMPLKPYIFLHNNAKLSENEKKILLDWIEITKDTLSKH